MGGGSKPKAPPMPSPTPMAVAPDIDKKSRDLRRKMFSNLGRAGTVLVPNTLGISDSEKNLTLG